MEKQMSHDYYYQNMTQKVDDIFKLVMKHH
jgi:hypothetical protein